MPDVSDWVSTVAVGGFTLAGTLGGIALANRHSAELALDARTEARRSALRDELSVLVVEVRALIDSAMLTMIFYSRAKHDDIMEFVNTDTGRDQARRGKQISTTIANLSLMVGDRQILDGLVTLEQCIHEWAEKVNGPAFEVAAIGGNTTLAIELGMPHVHRTRAALNALVVAANSVVQIPILTESPVTRWWSSWMKR